ncbi:antimicrobial peptide NK-lysin-like [Osmerus mordax]|uniref:antimicrobial peptide NK-lysin-like n=1 Tax=Osmerus mordax TaxID=8014 RepID=UPI00350F796C
MKSLFSLICLILAFSVMAVHGREVNYLREEWESGEEAREDTTLEKEMIPGTCGLCKYILNTVKKHLNSSDTSKNIKQKLLRSCDQIKFGKSMCRSICKKFSDILVKLFSNDEDVRTMCVDIKLCKPKHDWGISN